MPNTTQAKNTYHHGNLRQELLQEATRIISANGVEGLSLRKLAEGCGVSRSAPYHHFKDKHELLCAIATEGFLALEQLMRDSIQPQDSQEKQLNDFVLAYLHFACDQPERYDLMFGRQIWKLSQPTDELRDIAFRTFRRYARSMASLFASTSLPSNLPANSKPLRAAQASWATLHGLCRLLIDGIYIDKRDMEEVAQTAISLMFKPE